MPKFHGHDYYLLAAAEHMSRLNKAILAVPQSLQKHVSNCCLKIFDIWDVQSVKMNAFADLLEADLQNLVWAIKTCQDLKHEIVEFYEKDIIIRHNDCELFEVILSSNPESGCSLDSSLEESDVMCRKVFCAEEFAPVKTSTGNAQVFDEPLSVNDLRLAVKALPSVSVLLSRLMTSDLHDPLIKLNGSKWSEEDFQWMSYTHHDVSIDNTDDCDGVMSLMTETFSMFTLEGDDCHSLQTLLPYTVPNMDLEISPRHIDSHCMETVMNTGDCSWKDENLLLEDFESVHSNLVSGLSLVGMVHGLEEDLTDDHLQGFTPFITINNIGFSPPSHVSSDGRLFQKCLSPLIENRILEVVNDDDIITSRRLLLALLDALIAEVGLFDQCVIGDGNIKHMERQIWEQEKHFDEIHLPEPFLSQESLPNLITELSECLILQLEEAEAQNKDVDWSFDQPDYISNLYDMITLANDDCGPQQQQLLHDSESFEKFEVSELNYMLYSSHNQSEEDIFMEDYKQDTETVECADHSETYKNIKENVQLLDPLDSFIHMRGKIESLPTYGVHSCSGEQNKFVSTEGNQHNHVPSSDLTLQQSSNKLGPDIKTVQVIFSGAWEKVLQCIIDGAASHLEIIKQEDLLPKHQDFMDISVDTIKFLLKEREKQMLDLASLVSESYFKPAEKESILQSLTVLHTLRTAADLLVDTCLQSCISYLIANVDDSKCYIGKTCDEVHKQLFHYQCQFLHNNITHPKLSAVCHQVGMYSTKLPGCQILILVQKGLNSLTSAIQHILSTIPNLNVSTERDPMSVISKRATTTAVILAPMMEAWTKIITEFNLVILYNERQATNLKSFCQEKGVSYIGFLTQPFWDANKNERTHLQDKLSAVTLICSDVVTQNKQLVCLLEAKYNILVIEREYNKLCKPNVKIYYADLIVSVSHCIVLLSLQEMKKHWDLSEVVKTFIALGLQFSHCFIILHGMVAGSSYILDTDILRNIYKLSAALSSLKGTSPSFQASYKVFVSQTDEDVASTVRSIVDSYLSFGIELDLLRPWLAVDASQDEAKLLQINCINSFSAQILLNKLTLGEILEKPDSELITLFPDIPERIIKYMHYVVSNYQCQKSSTTNSVQAYNESDNTFSGSHIMLTQGSPHSYVGDTINVDQTQPPALENDIKMKISNPLTQTVETSHSFVIEDLEKVHPNYCPKFNASPRKSSRLKGNKEKMFPVQLNSHDFLRLELGPKGALLKQKDCSLNSKFSESTSSFLHSLEVAVECDDDQGFKEVTNKTGHERIVSSPSLYNPNKISFTQSPHQKTIFQGGAVNTKTDVFQWGFHQTAYSSPSCLEASLQDDINCPSIPWKKHDTFRTTYCSTQNQPHLQLSALISDSPDRFIFRDTNDNEQKMEYFNPHIDFQSCGNTLKQTNNSQWFSQYNNTYMTNKDEYNNVFDLHKADQSSYRSHCESFWNVDTNNEELTASDGLPLNFSLSNEHKEHSSLFASRFPSNSHVGSREIAERYSSSFTYGKKTHKQPQLSEDTLKKSTFGLRNDSSLSSLGVDCEGKQLVDIYHYNLDNGKSQLHDSTMSSAFRQYKHLNGSEFSYVPEPGTDGKGKSFGIFSYRAQRGTSNNDHVNIATNVMTDYTRNRNLMYNTQASTLPTSSSDFLSLDAVTDKTQMNFDSLPFSVSRDLRKHIKRLGCTSRDLQNPLLKGNPNSVRVSRQPDFCLNNKIFGHSDGSNESLILNQPSTEQVAQQNLYSLVKGVDPTTLGDVRQVSTKLSCYHKNHSHKGMLKFEDCVQPSISDQCSKFMSLQYKDHSNSYNKSSSSKNYQGSICSQVGYCNSDQPQSLIRNVTIPYLQQRDQNMNNYDETLPNNVRYTQQLNTIRMPYTPRHRIAVGLAQPFLRQISSPIPRAEISAGSPSHESARQQQQASFMTEALTSTVLSPESPPMDLVIDEDMSRHRRDEVAAYDQSTCEAKRIKWSKHLMSSTSQTAGQSIVNSSNSYSYYSRKDYPGTHTVSSNRKH